MFQCLAVIYSVLFKSSLCACSSNKLDKTAEIIRDHHFITAAVFRNFISNSSQSKSFAAHPQYTGLTLENVSHVVKKLWYY